MVFNPIIFSETCLFYKKINCMGELLDHHLKLHKTKSSPISSPDDPILCSKLC